MRKATVRKYKAVKQSARIIQSKRKVNRTKGIKKGDLERLVQAQGFTTQVNKRISEMMIDDAQMAGVYVAPQIHITEEMDLETGEITKIERKVQKMNDDQKDAMQKLVAKHKGDYRKMQMDNKVNVFVWSAQQCQKMHARYVSLYGEL